MKPQDKFDKPVFVTRPVLPDLSEYIEKLEEIWESGWLTNSGRMHQEFEKTLSEHLRVPSLSLFNNGTIALIVALQALRVRGEVITTPFTFPATPHVITWNGATPVFCDIDPDTLTIDSKQIERLVTANTTAILGVHVYGMPCDVLSIQRIADDYGIKVIYDGAHAFGTEIDGDPVSNYGDATMLSFHATKLFHSAEGGALITRDARLKARIDLLKNFGIKNETDVVMPGINGKMNELQAALGLVTLRHVEKERQERSLIARVYREKLNSLRGVECFSVPERIRDSLQFFIIRINAENAGMSRDNLYFKLREYNVFARRYFYPLCSEYNCYRSHPSAHLSNLPVANKVSSEVLALPFFGALGESGAKMICDIIEYELENI